MLKMGYRLSVLRSVHEDINHIGFVIPDLIRNPVFSWIPPFAGMTIFAGINAAGYNKDATTERQNCCPGAQFFSLLK
jgi:hypothetical protein